MLLFPRPDGYRSGPMREALAAAITRLPGQLRRSLTWDHGKEMGEHVRFTVDTGVQVYFSDPRSPWQRGTNENTNGLFRQYLPKAGDLGAYAPADLDDVATELNGRPRETPDWRTPAEHLVEMAEVGYRLTPPGRMLPTGPVVQRRAATRVLLVTLAKIRAGDPQHAGPRTRSQRRVPRGSPAREGAPRRRDRVPFATTSNSRIDPPTRQP